jgi:predicted ArsR family transcriptional regulator
VPFPNRVTVTETVGSTSRPASRAAYRALAGRSRHALLVALIAAGRAVDVDEAASAVGLHRNTARVQLDVLCSAGLLQRSVDKRGTRGRPRVVYAATPAGVELLLEEGAQASNAGYRKLAALLAGQLAEAGDARNAALRAGRRWAAALDEMPLPTRPLSEAEAVAVLTGLLDRLGFGPEPDHPGSRLLLRQCPFAEVARENRAIVCGVHLGMITAVAELLDAPLAVTGLDPFVADDPLLCVVRLSIGAEARSASGPARETQ